MKNKNFYSMFISQESKKAEDIFSSLTDDEQQFILRSHNYDLSNKRQVLSPEDTRKYYDLIYKIKCELGRNENVLFTDNLLQDFFGKLEYRKLTRSEEIHMIKKSKLSFLGDDIDSLSEDDKALFVKFYFDEFPEFKDKYESASNEERARIIKEAIADSFNYRSEFLKNNQGLIYTVARKANTSFLTLMELIQEGNIGLLMALQKFDVTRNIKFSTYACEWIRGSIERAIHNTEDAIRLPGRIVETVKRINFAEYDFEKDFLRKPTSEELSEMIGIPVWKIEQVKKEAITKMNVESLDRNIIEGSFNCLGDFIIDKNANFTDKFVEKNELENFHEFLKNYHLDREAKELLFLHFGFYNDRQYSTRYIADKLGVSRQTVMNKEEKILKKMRNDLILE